MLLTATWATNFAAIKLIFDAVPELHVSEYAVCSGTLRVVVNMDEASVVGIECVVLFFFGNATIIEMYSSTNQTTLTLENVTVFLNPKSITFVVLFLWYILVANTFYSRNSMVSNFFSEFSNMNIYCSVSNNDFCSPHFI